jgi:hypothetical protein
MKIFILILSFFFTSLNLFANELSTIEKAIICVDKRINQGIFLSEITDEKTFVEQASRQIEFALINLNSQDLLTEDWYNLALYCLARKYKYYPLALSILKKEYEIESYHKLRKWIEKRINLLKQSNFMEEEFDIKAELSDLRKNVF